MSSNYEKFIAANQALIDCMAAVDYSAYQQMDVKAQESVCQNEANVVSEHLRNDTASFRNLLQERLDYLKSQNWV